MIKKKDVKNAANWSGAAKVGAAVGSAALVAALLYAGRRSLTQKKGKLEPQSPPAGPSPANKGEAGIALKKTKAKIAKLKKVQPNTLK
jgi:hypothetical protein